MSANQRKRQKKLERKAAKRKEKRHALARQHSAGLADRLSAAAKYPILHCWIPDSVADEGIGAVVISRELPSSQVAVANLLVDTYCLGVKDCFAEIIDRATYEDRYLRGGPPGIVRRNVPPADARKLIEGAVAYARDLGLQPHPDYEKCMALFGDVDAASSDAEFDYGDEDGLPYFVAGPHDSRARCQHILSILEHSCGHGGYHFLLPADVMDGGFQLVDDLDDADGEEEEYEEEEED